MGLIRINRRVRSQRNWIREEYGRREFSSPLPFARKQSSGLSVSVVISLTQQKFYWSRLFAPARDSLWCSSCGNRSHQPQFVCPSLPFFLANKSENVLSETLLSAPSSMTFLFPLPYLLFIHSSFLHFPRYFISGFSTLPLCCYKDNGKRLYSIKVMKRSFPKVDSHIE